MQSNLDVLGPVEVEASSADEAIASFLPTPEASVHQTTATVIAQQFDQDIIGDLGNALRTFVESGQIWALIIGFVLGFMLRGVTTYK
jgi:hypothetical protein